MHGGVAQKNGFTIVELLIVIVVIGILAAITIVAYTGISNQAKQAQLISAVDSYQKGLENYKTLNGDYPWTAVSNDGTNYIATDPSNPSDYACLGEDWPAQDGMSQNVCISTSGSSTADVAQVSPQINAKLKTTLGVLPTANGDTATFTNGAGLIYHYRGVTYEGRHNNVTKTTTATIQFIRLGSQTTCGRGSLQTTAFSGVTITQCQLTLN